MKIYDTNYGPDTFGHIRMGLITEMFLTFKGYLKPEVGDHLRISCLFKDIVRDVYTVAITKISDCMDEPEMVLIQVEAPSTDKPTKTFEGVYSPFDQLTYSKVIH